MSKGLASYQEAVRQQEADLQAKLLSGRASVGEIAVARRTAEMMGTQLKTSPNSLLMYDGFRGAQRWHLAMYRRASDELFPESANQATADAHVKKFEEYLNLGLELVRSPDMRYRSVVDRRTGKSYLYRENPLVPRIMKVIATCLMDWFQQHRVDAAFLRQSARVGLADFLVERPDIIVLLRIAQTLPLDSEISDVLIQPPLVVETLELAIGLVPLVGNMAAVYEAYAGADLFGYRLNNLERSIIAASVLLPLAGRLVKEGRAVYTEARLVALYGQEASAWSRAVQAGARTSASGPALQAIERAEATILKQRKLASALAIEAADALPKLVHNAASVSSSVDQSAIGLLRELSLQHKVLSHLDDLAVSRVLEKGPNVDHIKGQLLEELLESRVVPWLRDRSGSFALGVQTGTKKLEFIPGHMIRDSVGRQITDGILGYRNNGVLDIVGVFEAKAGRSAARELSITKGTISSLAAEDRLELRAAAKDIWREQRDDAKQAGKLFKKTIEDVEREINLAEHGGQIRRDIERLGQNADGTLAQLKIGADALPVRISPTKTKFFGVLPSDVNSSLMASELRKEGFVFEMIGVDINQADLNTIANRLKPLAKQTAAAAP